MSSASILGAVYIPSLTPSAACLDIRIEPLTSSETLPVVKLQEHSCTLDRKLDIHCALGCVSTAMICVVMALLLTSLSLLTHDGILLVLNSRDITNNGNMLQKYMWGYC